MLEVAGLNARYGRAHILQDVGFAVGTHEVLALLGRNGAGKSTVMKSIMGLVEDVTGSVRFADAEMRGRPAHAISQAGIGYVPEDRRIFKDLTVLENLEVGRRGSHGDAPGWTRESLFDLFPNLRERQTNLGKQLSGGEQQMLTIARTLMGNPRLLLLDEPSEGIAPVIVEQMARVILKLKAQGLAVLISEQNLHFARAVADRAAIIEKGVIRYEGSFVELDAQPQISEQYLAV